MLKNTLFGIGLILLLSACATHKAPSPPVSVNPPLKDFNFYLRQGNWFLRHKDYGKAIIQFNKAIALKPNSAKAHNLLGIAYFQRKDYDLAKEQFEKAIKITPSYAEAFNNLGSLYFITRKLDKAEEMFKKSLAISPRLVAPYYSLGTLLIAQGRVKEAATYLSKGIELDPEFLTRNKAFVTRFSSASLNTPEAYFLYAKIYAASGNLEKTIEYLKKADKAGFKDWDRIEQEEEFQKVKDDPRIKSFIRKHRSAEEEE
ncbi:MAG: tetratricopeptide repeat protein [Acidobacteria bacterium]|nr:tetratricopeptide repeat protein [Acidobacteriota bacterium]